MSHFALSCSECHHRFETDDEEDFKHELGWHMAMGHPQRDCLLYAVRAGYAYQGALVRMEHVTPAQRVRLAEIDAEIGGIK